MRSSTAEEAIFFDLNLKGSGKILDIGCGDGKLTKAIADKLSQGEVTAIDQSEHMIQ